MHILQIGAPKSGNLWLYQIVQSVLQRAGLPRHSLIQTHPIHPIAQTWDLSHAQQADLDVLDIEPLACYYRISSVFRMPITDIDAYIAQCSHVWTHSILSEGSFAVYPKFDKRIYIVRDPRDRTVSASRFALTPYMQKYYPHGEPDAETWLAHHFTEEVIQWVAHVGDHLRYSRELDIHFIFYERLLHAFEDELAALLTYLQVDLDASGVAGVKRDVDFDRMKRRSPQHVRQGTSGQWKQVLRAEQQREAEQIAGPLLALLGYPTGGHETVGLPAVPPGIDKAQVNRVLGWT